mmetsp:Transcript_15333/g.31744  ORF Transcript_15333/g.31744 Transcript_15333/m.31744 type:complete len:407 (+) Transcript_15333:285-1505(+)
MWLIVPAASIGIAIPGPLQHRPVVGIVQPQRRAAPGAPPPVLPVQGEPHAVPGQNRVEPQEPAVLVPLRPVQVGARAHALGGPPPGVQDVRHRPGGDAGRERPLGTRVLDRQCLGLRGAAAHRQAHRDQARHGAVARRPDHAAPALTPVGRHRRRPPHGDAGISHSVAHVQQQAQGEGVAGADLDVPVQDQHGTAVVVSQQAAECGQVRDFAGCQRWHRTVVVVVFVVAVVVALDSGYRFLGQLHQRHGGVAVVHTQVDVLQHPIQVANVRRSRLRQHGSHRRVDQHGAASIVSVPNRGVPYQVGPGQRRRVVGLGADSLFFSPPRKGLSPGNDTDQKAVQRGHRRGDIGGGASGVGTSAASTTLSVQKRDGLPEKVRVDPGSRGEPCRGPRQRIAPAACREQGGR